MILETLSQYSATMVLKETYGDTAVQKFLKIQLDKYLEGKRRMKQEEVPLAVVENESYIYYAKGAINMYALQQAIGEEKVNSALKSYFQDWHSFQNPNKPKRYTTTEDLLGYFRQATPDSLQYVIRDLFEQVKPLNEAFVTQ